MSGPANYLRHEGPAADGGLCAACFAWIEPGAAIVTVTPIENVMTRDVMEQRLVGLPMACCSEDCADTFEVEAALEAGCARI